MFGGPAAIRRVGDRPAVGRPGRVDVQRALRRDAPLVLAVVVGDVDLLDAAVLDRAGHPLAVAIGVERQLRARDAAQRPLLLVDVVGDRVRVEPRVRRPTRCTPCRTPTAGVRTLNSRTSTERRSSVFCTVPTITPSAFSSRQRSNGTSAIDVAGGIVAYDVARDQRELALEVQVVAQHLRDRLGGVDRFGVVRRAR